MKRTNTGCVALWTSVGRSYTSILCQTEMSSMLLTSAILESITILSLLCCSVDMEQMLCGPSLLHRTRSCSKPAVKETKWNGFSKSMRVTLVATVLAEAAAQTVTKILRKRICPDHTQSRSCAFDINS